MIIDALLADTAPVQMLGVERCPICNARATRALNEGVEYQCGAQVIPSTHGSWSISTPCPAELIRP